MVNKSIVITYNVISEIPKGRHEAGQVVVYSGSCVQHRYDGTILATRATPDFSKQELSVIRCAFMRDLENPEYAQVYLCAGCGSLLNIVEMCEIFRHSGKELIMVGCDCREAEKRALCARYSWRCIISPNQKDCDCAEILQKIFGDNKY